MNILPICVCSNLSVGVMLLGLLVHRQLIEIFLRLWPHCKIIVSFNNIGQDCSMFKVL